MMTANFTAFLKLLGVSIVPTDMSFAVSVDGGAFEWGSPSIFGFLAQFCNVFKSSFWRLAFDILRFNTFAADVLAQDDFDSSHDPSSCSTHLPSTIIDQNESIGNYLRRNRYSKQFQDHYIIPMVAAPWCIDPDEFSNHFPANALIKFM